MQAVSPVMNKKGTSDMDEPYNTVTDAAQALRLLKEGNERYLREQLSDKGNYAEEREALAKGQRPFAVVLTCSDSRTPPEIFFDQKLGDLFTIRVAGNIAGPSCLGSIEYAVERLKTPLVVVAGHSECGAVIAAYRGAEAGGNLKIILDRIRSACGGSASEEDAIRDNIRHTVEQIRNNEVVARCRAVVAGAYYDIRSGVVSWR